MADLRYRVEVDTRRAENAIDGLKDTILAAGAALGSAFAVREIATVSARFEDLRTTLGFLYNDIEAGAQAFEQIKQFATQSVLGVDDLTESVVKLKAAGLDPTIEQLRLFSDVSSVTTDRIGTLQAITDLFARTTAGGLGLEDLNRLQDRGIPVFSILAERIGLARNEIGEFGQSAEGAQIILQALTEGFEDLYSGASASRAENLSQAFSNLEDALQNTFDTIGQSGFNQALADAINGITQFLEANQVLIQSIGVALGEAIRFAAENLKFLAAIMAGVFAAAAAGRIIAITSAVIELTKAFRNAAIAGTVLQGVTGVGLVKVGAGLAAAAGAIATIESLTGDASSNIEDLQNSLDDLGDGPLTTPNIDAPESPDFGAGARIEELRRQQAELTRSTINYFDEYRQGVDDLRNNIRQQTELVGLTEEQANVQRELNQFQEEYFNTIRPLQQKITELRAKDTEESRTQADEIERQIGLITDLYNESSAGLREQLELRESINSAAARQLELEEALNERLDNREDFMSTMRDRIRDANRELEGLNLDPFQQELENIRVSLDNDLGNAIERLRQQAKDGLITSDEEIAEIRRLEQVALETEQTLIEIATRRREQQRSFSQGWKEAFESYKDDATNAAKTAGEIFNKTTKGMEDAIVNFAKTGKFEFKDLINTILEELLRSQIRQLIAQTFGSFGPGGGAGGLSNLFAGFFANGGTIPAGQFGVVGERGPELVSGPATVTPMAAGGENVTYNIQAVDARSFKQLVAEDPGFIHAVAQQGGKRIPTRR